MGLPRDWESLDPFFDKAFSDFERRYINLYEDLNRNYVAGSEPSLLDWARQFNQKVEASGRPSIIVGYSLGGRLALHCLVDRPDLWSSAVIISSHPGLMSEAEREQRKVQDEEMAKNFLSDPWGDLMIRWNRQSVLSSSVYSPLRVEADYYRDSLAWILLFWSLSRQRDLRQALSKIKIPILWIAGRSDEKYSRLAQEMSKLSPHFREWIADCCGHRVPWEDPEGFSLRVHEFLRDFLISSFKK